MKVGRLVIKTATLYFSSVAFALSDAQLESCDRVVHSLQVLHCAQLFWEDAKQEVQAAHAALNARVKDQYAVDEYIRDELLGEIETAQLAWSASVKHDCELLNHEIERGTQAYEAAFYSCATVQFQKRMHWLNELVSY